MGAAGGTIGTWCTIGTGIGINCTGVGVIDVITANTRGTLLCIAIAGRAATRWCTVGTGVNSSYTGGAGSTGGAHEFKATITALTGADIGGAARGSTRWHAVATDVLGRNAIVSSGTSEFIPVVTRRAPLYIGDVARGSAFGGTVATGILV